MIALLEDRAVLRVAGAAAREFLQGLMSQDMAAAEDRPAFAALLTPQGKILAEFLIARRGEGYLFDCAVGALEDLLRKLALYRLRAAVELQPLPDFGVAVALDGRPADFEPDPRFDALPPRRIGPRAVLPAQGASAAGSKLYHARRVALGVPELGKDFGSDEMFLLDVNYDALNAVSYRKGCFVGQEVTSRMKRKGEVRRRTLIARYNGSAPAKGTPVAAGDSTLGEILSGSEGSALAAIRLDRLDVARKRGDPINADMTPIELAFPDYLEPG